VTNWWVGDGAALALARGDITTINNISYPFFLWDNDVDIQIDINLEYENINKILNTGHINALNIPLYVEWLTQGMYQNISQWIQHSYVIGILSSKINGFHIEVWATQIYSKQHDFIEGRCVHKKWDHNNRNFMETLYPLRQVNVNNILYNYPGKTKQWATDKYGSIDIPFAQQLMCWSFNGITPYWVYPVFLRKLKFNIAIAFIPVFQFLDSRWNLHLDSVKRHFIFQTQSLKQQQCELLKISMYDCGEPEYYTLHI